MHIEDVARASLKPRFATRSPSPLHAPIKTQAKPMADAPAISPLRDLRYRAEYLGLRILIGLVRLVPIEVAGSISAMPVPGWP